MAATKSTRNPSSISSSSSSITVHSSTHGGFSLSVLSPNMIVLVVLPAILLGIYAVIVTVWDMYYVLINDPLEVPLIHQYIGGQGLWSTYSSLSFGMAWYVQSGVGGVEGVVNDPVILHTCDSPLVSSYWNKHDGISFGQQIIRSNEGYSIRSEFISSSHPGAVSDTWTLRVTAQPLMKSQGSFLSLILYLYNEGAGQMELAGNIDKGMVEEIFGHTPQMKDYRVHFPYKFFTNSTDYSFMRAHLPPATNITTLLRDSLVTHNGIHRLPNYKTTPTKNGSINFIAYQINSLLLMPVEIDTVFESGLYSAALSISGNRFTESLNMKHAVFDQRFEEVFKLVAKGFSMETVIMCKRILSDVLASIKHDMITNTRGTSLLLVSLGNCPDYRDVLISEIIERCPDHRGLTSYFSIPLFGSSDRDGRFDIINEGYYQLLIAQWNLNITKRVIGHWFDTMNNNGWMPSEVGGASIHDTSIGYAPSILMAVDSMITLMEKKGEMDNDYLKVLFTRLEVWFSWFNDTQRGPFAGTYSWNGRVTNSLYLNPETPPSGMGDYPRPSEVSHGEYHLDLRCWISLGARVLAKMSNILKDGDESYYNNMYRQLMDIKRLDNTHWSTKYKVYSDYGVHNPNIKLTKTQSGKLSKHITGNSNPRFIGSVGYVSIFPLMLMILPPDSPKLGLILKNLQDPTLLWSEYGVRSLAKTDYFYHKPNRLTAGSDEVQYHWRGPVHVHINYLILKALNHYSKTAGPYVETAYNILKDLRRNLINTVLKEYKRTGSLWAHYSDKTGHGKGDRNANLSSLILLIMAEIY